MSSPLTALSPLDGRYASQTRALQDHFSEFALIRHRVRIEIAWLKALAAEPAFAALPREQSEDYTLEGARSHRLIASARS